MSFDTISLKLQFRLKNMAPRKTKNSAGGKNKKSSAVMKPSDAFSKALDGASKKQLKAAEDQVLINECTFNIAIRIVLFFG